VSQDARNKPERTSQQTAYLQVSWQTLICVPLCRSWGVAPGSLDCYGAIDSSGFASHAIRTQVGSERSEGQSAGSCNGKRNEGNLDPSRGKRSGVGDNRADGPGERVILRCSVGGGDWATVALSRSQWRKIQNMSERRRANSAEAIPLNIHRTQKCLLFLLHFPGAPGSEGFCFQSERLLYRREANGVRAEPGKQKTRNCRTQELA
jgi:hypothetical protein